MATASRKGGGKGAPREAFAPAVRETLECAARIRKMPRACPMFPEAIGDGGITETICCMQGYLAGRVASTGKRPTRREMRALRHAVMHDPKVGDIVVGTQKPVRLGASDAYPDEFWARTGLPLAAGAPCARPAGIRTRRPGGSAVRPPGCPSRSSSLALP